MGIKEVVAKDKKCGYGMVDNECSVTISDYCKGTNCIAWEVEEGKEEEGFCIRREADKANILTANLLGQLIDKLTFSVAAAAAAEDDSGGKIGEETNKFHKKL